MFECRNYLLASALHPNFKLNWLNGKKKEDMRDMLKALVNQGKKTPSPTDEESTIEDFFTFQSPKSAIKTELDRYLEEPSCNLSALKHYPDIKKLFIRYNTPLPSSAPVERLFSQAGIVFSQRRAKLSDKQLEILTLLKIKQNQ